MPHVLPLSLLQRRPGRIRPRLDAVTAALEALGDPQTAFPSILITGTNGKGSTAAMLASILDAHGVRTGLYTSPHLVRVEERMRVGGEPVQRRCLERHLESLDAFPELTFFETLTVTALLVFAEASVDCAVLEAGMGGRWDATRAAAPVIAGLTNVGTDHQRWLGADRAEIARDKGAALAAAASAALGPGLDPDIRPHVGAPCAVAADALASVAAVGRSRVAVAWGSHRVEVRPALTGRHQVDNLHLALALARAAEKQGLLDGLSPEKVRSGLATVTWPGRLTRHQIDGREVLLDAAHNLEGARALAIYLESEPTRYNLLFSCLDDKPVDEMARVLRRQVGEVVVCPIADARAMPLPRLLSAFSAARSAPDPIRGLRSLQDPVLGAGSLRLLGALLEHEERGDPR